MGIQKIPATLEELFALNEAFEEKYMVPAKSNEAMANATVSLFLSKVPWFLKPFGRQCVYAMCDKRCTFSYSINC
jgi:hypothetical protein